MKRIRSRAGKRQQARIGAPDRSLTANAGLAAVTALRQALAVIDHHVEDYIARARLKPAA